MKSGKIKKEKPLPEITEDEKPFDIPEQWCSVRIGDVGIYKKGPFGSSLTKSMFVPKSLDAVKVYEQKMQFKKTIHLENIILLVIILKRKCVVLRFSQEISLLVALELSAKHM